ncbi:hypothetical protein C6Q22_25650 [Burkholderia multivorans]|uniref:Uncharacterized protein n=1 Tax=Burkholderia multivorans TaxID=87883 RepID=A0A8E2UR48_9BURK|nr:hypothetical protein C6P76_10580 [Burkholderia multivorans]PRF20614.1 hypothetical protein C6P98_21965 [Burkholderia multivorans]PRF26209.1 hypothetical protein C6Q03_06740 [Burkholderia multivorans]PRF80520.1 hypothetical protein C6Q22_25650 [Burkholderia multivorans]PRG83138.1 hypothetical protein C6T66_22740 [Burkholderia multivorans]
MRFGIQDESCRPFDRADTPIRFRSFVPLSPRTHTARRSAPFSRAASGAPPTVHTNPFNTNP